MAIAVDQNYDKAQRKISTANLKQFAGVDCQLLVEKETHRPIIMDGSTLGGKFKCASTDELEAVKDSALPLAGGTVTGQIATTHIQAFKKNTDDSIQTILGASSLPKGAWLALFGNDADDTRAGGFVLANGNNISLSGLKDNSLTWNTKEVETVNVIGENYIRYESGLQICWGYQELPANSKSMEVLLPVPCKDANHVPIGVLTDVINGQTFAVCVNALGQSNKFTIMCATFDNRYDFSRGCYWLDVGRWK